MFVYAFMNKVCKLVHKTIQKSKVVITIKVRTVVNLGRMIGTQNRQDPWTDLSENWPSAIS